MNRLLIAAAFCALLAGCEAQEPDNQAQAPGNEVMPPAETRTADLGEPVAREQALPLMHERHENYEKIGDSMKVISR